MAKQGEKGCSSLLEQYSVRSSNESCARVLHIRSAAPCSTAHSAPLLSVRSLDWEELCPALSSRRAPVLNKSSVRDTEAPTFTKLRDLADKLCSDCCPSSRTCARVLLEWAKCLHQLGSPVPRGPEPPCCWCAAEGAAVSVIEDCSP